MLVSVANWMHQSLSLWPPRWLLSPAIVPPDQRKGESDGGATRGVRVVIGSMIFVFSWHLLALPVQGSLHDSVDLPTAWRLFRAFPDQVSRFRFALPRHSIVALRCQLPRSFLNSPRQFQERRQKGRIDHEPNRTGRQHAANPTGRAVPPVEMVGSRVLLLVFRSVGRAFRVAARVDQTPIFGGVECRVYTETSHRHP